MQLRRLSYTSSVSSSECVPAERNHFSWKLASHKQSHEVWFRSNQTPCLLCWSAVVALPDSLGTLWHRVATWEKVHHADMKPGFFEPSEELLRTMLCFWLAGISPKICFLFGWEPLGSSCELQLALQVYVYRTMLRCNFVGCWGQTLESRRMKRSCGKRSSLQTHVAQSLPQREEPSLLFPIEIPWWG